MTSVTFRGYQSQVCKGHRRYVTLLHQQMLKKCAHYCQHLIKDSESRVFAGVQPRRNTLPAKYPNSILQKEKLIFSINHIVYINSLGITFISSGNDGNLSHLSPGGFTGEFYQMIMAELAPILNKLLKKKWWKHFLNHFMNPVLLQYQIKISEGKLYDNISYKHRSQNLEQNSDKTQPAI